MDLDKRRWINGAKHRKSTTLIADDNYTLIAHFSAIPPNEIDFSLVSNPVGSGILFDDPDRIWDVDSDLYQRTISGLPKLIFIHRLE